MWKIYFVVIMIISVAGYIWQGLPRFYEFIDVIVFAFSAVGLYGYAWGRGYLSQGFWKMFFIIMLVWTILYHYFIPVTTKVAESLQGQSQASVATIGLIFYIPLIIAIFLYGFQREDLW